MTFIYVRFSDMDEKVVDGVFGGSMEINPQSLEVYPYQGQVEDSDPRYLAFMNPPAPTVTDPVDKLKTFLAVNPDVAAILS